MDYKATDNTVLPLTETMTGMFLEWNENRDSLRYTVALAHVFPRTVNPDRLAAAVEATVATHPVFRLRFVETEDGVRWLLEDTLRIRVRRTTLSDAEADRHQQTFPGPFDLLAGPLARFELVETPTSFRLLTEIHHIITDGSSMRIFLDSVTAAANGSPSTAPAGSFADYVRRETASFSSPDYAAARDDARARFAGTSMTVPALQPFPPPVPPHPADAAYLESVRDVPRAAVDAFCRANRLHPNLFFLGAFARTLALFAHERRVVFCTVNHGRGRTPDFKATCGCFVKPVPVLGDLSDGSRPLADYLASFRIHRAGVYPFTHLCRDLGLTLGWTLAFQEGTVDFQFAFDGVPSTALLNMNGGAGEMPALEVIGQPNAYRLRLVCEPGRYDAAFLAAFTARLQVIVENFAAADPSTPIREIPVLTPEEAAAVLEQAYGGDLLYDPSLTFVDLFRRQAAARPDVPAITACDGALSYAELDRRSDALAAALAARDVVPGDFVALKLPRRTSFVVALLAVQKCGAGYVPLDPEYPQDRLDYMVADSGAKLLLDAATFTSFSSQLSTSNSQLSTSPSPSSPAYMIYTSGSTGRPKGVPVPQRALVNLIKWFERDCGIGPGKKNVHLASFSFDASVPDLFAPLACGGEVHLLDEDMRKDLQAVGDYCVAQGITGATMSTQMGLALVNAYPELPLDYMMLGGEKMVAFAKTPVRMLNGYGPTEFCVCSSYHEVDQTRAYDIPIGRAVPNTWSFVVDPLGQPVPAGMTGEIALAGIQLADGYWHQPAKTAAAFVPISFDLPGAGTLLYRTGDLGRTNAAGELEFLGRLDFQVKLRGFRIEIGEIEHVASTFPGVQSVIALVKKVSGSDHLVLYYTSSTPAETSPAALRAHLAKTLTAYMVPDFLVALDAMPLTPGGKIDRAALPAPEQDAQPIEEPANETERQILDAVRTVLRRTDLGVTHDFNQLGLTSLDAMALAVRLKKAMGIKVSLRQLADNPSVRQLGRTLARPHDATETSASTSSASDSSGHAGNAPSPMTENQRGIYADWLRNPGTTQYNVPVAIKFPSQDAAKLAEAVRAVLAAHASFAVQFAEENGELVQRLVPDALPAVTVTRLDAVPDDAFFTQRMRPFKPTGEPLVRAEVFAAGDAAYLFLDAHHTIFDGCSVGILLNELVRALDGQAPQGEAYTALDAAREERAYLAGAEAQADERWFADYLGTLESTRLETSTADLAARAGAAGRVRRRLPSAAIAARCRALGVTASDYFLTCFTELLRRVGRSEDVLINFVTAGRSNPDSADATGMFVKTLPLKGIRDATTFDEAVRRMHADVADLIDRERVSYVRLAEQFGLRPDVLFAFEGGLFDLPRGMELLMPETDTVKTPFTATVTPGADAFELAFEYDRALYADADMERLLARFAALAAGAAATSALREIPLVADDEARRLLDLSYGGDLAYDRSTTFLDLFRANAAARPDAIAVVDCETSLTYGELDRRSDALAAVLASRGVTPGGFVGVMLPRRVSFIVSVLAVQKCGAAYIPMDPDYPRDRIDYMVSDSGAALLIDAATFTSLSSQLSTLNSQLSTSNSQLSTLPAPSPASPAYMIYTSGSTGRPKGVVVPHRALRNMIAWTMRDYGIGPASRVATHPSFSFDASVIDIFPTLAAGGQLHIYSEELRKDLASIRDYIVRNGITGSSMSTQIGMALVNTFPDLPLDYLQMGGEKMMPVAPTKIRLINGYGPTEFCVCSSFEIVDQTKDGDIPIGRAVPNTYSVIVDRYGHLLPQGMAGELALIGPQIADGYWQNPEKTAAAFVPVPFALPRAAHPLLYRTGDLARYNAEGKIEYLGRLDFQVKLRGFRIEIGEIESVAKAFPGVGSVAAEVRDVGGAKHLVLYYEGPVDEAALKAAMAARLTAYMVPDFFVALETMPVTPNGKINRKLLRAPTPEAAETVYVEPANDAERRIAAIFGDVLKTDRIGATDDFFARGGTSIVAIMAVIALQKAGFDLQYGDVFKYKTPRALAAFAAGGSAPETTKTPAADAAFDYGAYDYAAIDDLLAGTRRDLFGDFSPHLLGDVLLTGATGYLGMHILRYLLESTQATVRALVRPKRGVGAARRIDAQWVYYFGSRLPERLRGRLAFVEGDITDADLAARVTAGGASVSTVINCAALVKHYVADDQMDRINVRGVENLIDLCEALNARLVHTSTYSIGGTVRADSAVGLDERHLYVGQESDNDYVRTKFLAERAVLAATAAGRIRGKIMRLGNLMGRESDGEFQMNVGANAFINSLRTYKALGAYPLDELARPLEMSPIDRVAEAICLLATTPDDLYVFHPYNRYALDMGAVIGAMNAHGFEIDAVSADDFAAHVDALRNDPAHAALLQGILHYAGHLLENRKTTPVDNAWTTTVLYRLGFRWRPADDAYLANFLTMLEGLAAFS